MEGILAVLGGWRLGGRCDHWASGPIRGVATFGGGHSASALYALGGDCGMAVRIQCGVANLGLFRARHHRGVRYVDSRKDRRNDIMRQNRVNKEKTI